MIQKLVHLCNKLSLTHLIIIGLVGIETLFHNIGFHIGLEGIIMFLCACNCHVQELEK